MTLIYSDGTIHRATYSGRFITRNLLSLLFFMLLVVIYTEFEEREIQTSFILLPCTMAVFFSCGTPEWAKFIVSDVV